MNIYDLEDALEKGLIDIHTFRTGRRPSMSEESIIALVLQRFKVAQHAPLREGSRSMTAPTSEAT